MNTNVQTHCHNPNVLLRKNTYGVFPIRDRKGRQKLERNEMAIRTRVCVCVWVQWWKCEMQMTWHISDEDASDMAIALESISHLKHVNCWPLDAQKDRWKVEHETCCSYLPMSKNWAEVTNSRRVTLFFMFVCMADRERERDIHFYAFDFIC